MCTDILRGMKIIATIPKAVPVVTVARTTIIAAWGISRSIAMVMAAVIRMSMLRNSTMTAAVAMTTLYKRSMSIIMLRAQLGTLRMRMMTVAVDTSIIITGMRSMSTTTVAVGTSIIMSMKSMSTMSVAVGTSTITSTHIMCRGIPMTANVKFAILTRSTAMFVAKA